MGGLGLVIFLGSRNLSSRAFAHSVLWVTLWMVGTGFLIAATEYETAIFFSRLTYFLGTTIASAFLCFLITYPEDKCPSRALTLTLTLGQYALAYVFLLTDWVIPDMFPLRSRGWGWEFGGLSLLFEAIFFGFFAYGIAILYRKYKHSNDENTRTNLKFMIWTIFAGTIPPSVFCVIMPRLGHFSLVWLGPILEIVWMPIIAYSIIRYRQMNVRVIATKVLAIALVAMFFINIFINEPFKLWGRAAVFLIFVTTACFLIRGTMREARQRDELDRLNRGLEAKVAEQTLEIRKAYEAEKHARMELEKLNDAKDQFILITQHHMRYPVTKILCTLESALEGAHGEVSRELAHVLENVRASGQRLMRIVDDFLNVTAIKVGANILSISQTSLKPAVEEILNELRSDITCMGLSIVYPQDDGSWPSIPVDMNKIHECLHVIIENAIRYNRTEGTVTIATRRYDDLFEITASNTGIGISEEESQKIGSALFYRSEYARIAHPIGMGVGLSVVKAIIRAHHGTFKIESRGPGEGAKATITLPLR